MGVGAGWGVGLSHTNLVTTDRGEWWLTFVGLRSHYSPSVLSHYSPPFISGCGILLGIFFRFRIFASLVPGLLK